jgi:protein transport protein SEC24
LEDAREALEYKLAEIIAVYRSLFKSSGQGEMLILPNNMKFLPLFILGLLKNV